MKAKFIFYILIFLTLCSCQGSYGVMNRTKGDARTGAPSGKFKNPTLFSRANPYQGRAKSKLNKSKKKKKKLFKKKHKQRGTSRKFKKPGKNFGFKRTVSRKRLKSSGSRIKSSSGRQKKNKNLFKTRKK